MLIKIRFPKIHIALGPIDIPLSVAVGEAKPGMVRFTSLSGSGTEKSSSRSCGIFPSLRLRRGLMNLPEATDPFGI